MVQGPDCKIKGLVCEVEGSDGESRRGEEGGCKRQGVGTEKHQGDTLGFGG